MARRPALYSTYSFDRKVGAPTSKAATANSGRDASTMASIDVNPYAALVTCPSEVLICGNGQRGRSMRLRASLRPTRPRLPLATLGFYGWPDYDPDSGRSPAPPGRTG